MKRTKLRRATLEFSCVEACGDSYSTTRGLGKHQFHCKIYSTSLSNDLNAASISREAAKRRRLDEHAAMIQDPVTAVGDQIAPVVGECSHLPASDGCIIGMNGNGDIPASEPMIIESKRAGPSRLPVAATPAGPIPHPSLDVDISVIELPSESEQLGRGKRKKKQAQRYVNQKTTRRKKVPHYTDPQPEPPAPLPESRIDNSTISPLCTGLHAVSPAPVCRTERNSYGLYREYVSQPSYVPDESIDIQRLDGPEPSIGTNGSEDALSSDLLPPNGPDLPSSLQGAQAEDSDNKAASWFWPFLNATTYRLLSWFWTGSQHKSIADLQMLVDKVLNAKDFKLEDLRTFNAKRESERLDAIAEQSTNVLGTVSDVRDGWKETSVNISLPDRCARTSEADGPQFTVSGLFYRSLVGVIQSAFRSEDALRYHFTPYKQLWCPILKPTINVGDDADVQRPGPSEENSGADLQSEPPPQRIYGELYSSDAWIEAHEKLQRERKQDDPLENVIAGMMLWSDSTHLAQFGDASLWPMYLYFGNQSKYERCRPTSHASHHIAYLPELPDSVSEAFRKRGCEAKKPTAETLSHCRRDLIQALLAKLFDDEFELAYREGIVIECKDGVTRRIFPRIFTWSADYPEKVMLSSIRYLSDYPCPRCLVAKTEVHELGLHRNNRTMEKKPRVDSSERRWDVVKAREFIYKLGRGVKCVAVAAILFGRSIVPIINTLSSFLFPFGENFYRIFVVDLMHEFELGVWKTTFTQLIQIVSDGVPDGLSKLNERYRAMPTFGSDTIRRFTSDASSMTQLGARDFEDLLICAMPAFEGLLPAEHNEIVLNLLFSLATWHALAKLRMHTDATLKLLEDATNRLGEQLRIFQQITCKAYETQELKTSRVEAEKKKQKRGKVVAKTRRRTKAKASPHDTQGKTTTSKKRKEKKRKVFNLNNYKTHALAHYAYDIRTFGSVDSYSTQSGELEHRQVKKYYARTNKNNATKQIARIERREHYLRDIAHHDPIAKSVDEDSVPFTESEKHHHISVSRSRHIYLPQWLREHDGDPATVDFRNKLKDHILERLLGLDFDGDDTQYSEEERNTVQIEYNRLYEHKVVRVNHTTYDLRRSQDSMNPRTHSDIMILAPAVIEKGILSEDSDEDYEDESHPFWYAKIIGVFHANIRHTGPKSNTSNASQKMEFLWVRWYGQASQIPSGWLVQRLHAVQFVPKWNEGAFGFIDPSQVVRGAHLVPAFHKGKALSRLTNSLACIGDDEEWEYYYVNSFVDRDMFLRYAGGGVGHMHILLANKLRLLKSTDLRTESSNSSDPTDFSITHAHSTLATYSEEHIKTMQVNEDDDELQSCHEPDEDAEDSSSDSGGEE